LCAVYALKIVDPAPPTRLQIAAGGFPGLPDEVADAIHPAGVVPKLEHDGLSVFQITVCCDLLVVLL
jgi:hypothetical protein